MTKRARAWLSSLKLTLAPCATAVAALALCATAAQAQQKTLTQKTGKAALRADIPAPLLPWVPWVLADAPERSCAFTAGRALCYWPGQLTLELDDRGGRFSQEVVVDRDLASALPGSAARWPRAVRVDKKACVVLDDSGVPSVALREGTHLVEGSFEWKTLPERLELPAQTASVALTVRGVRQSLPRRDERGQLWLQGGPSGGETNEQLALSVSRKIEDGVPLIVTTRIKLRVSGRAREVNLGAVLLAGTTPLSLTSELPARLEERGELRLQVRAGTYVIELRALAATPPEAFAYRRASPLWPESEIWVWLADESLRQVELSGAAAIEPSRTELDADFRGLPAFALREGNALRCKTLRRGEPTPPPNRLGLNRELWLDLDGRGYTVRDRIDADMRQGFRLDLLAGELGHLSADNEDQLITKAKDQKHTGVELRKRKQAIVAEWRLPDAGAELPAVGWSEDVQSLALTLHLGPGFRLLAARGADWVSESWLQGWDLFDFFFVLLVSLAVGRLAGRAYAVLALAALVLCHGEADAPVGVWFALLTLIALLRVLPSGLIRNAARAGYAACIACLVLIALPFAIAQLRVAVYPQLAQPWSFGAESREYDLAESEPPSSPAPKIVGILKASVGRSPSYGGAPEAEAVDESAQRALQQDPEATVQTGPGIPSWSFRTWTLRWSGPVDKAHSLRLFLLTPIENRLLSILRVVLLGLLIAVLLRAATPGAHKPGAKTDPPPAAPALATASLVVLLSCLLPLLVPALARADIPDKAVLDQLRERVLKPAECRPNCASIDDLAIDIRDTGLTLSLALHAGERTSISVPGPAGSLVPERATLDKKDAPMVLLEDGFLHLRVEPGVHSLELRFALPASDTLALSFGDRPHHARVEAVGWKVDGVREDGSVEGALQLSRMLSDSKRVLEGAALPPFLLLERTIELGPSWEVHSQLRRISPTGTPIVVRVPLLPGEAVTESGLEVQDGELHVAFGRDAELVNWSSRLAIRERIELSAPKDKPWSERWKLLCGPIWRCEIDGLTPVHWLADEHVQPELAPWPGERATINVSRPESAKGQSITIDEATLEVTPGVRMQKASLALRIRSSRGSSESLELPAHARVQQLSIDDHERPVHESAGRLAFGLEPGVHEVKVQWQEARGLALVERAPALKLGRAAANVSVIMHVPRERWLLWASGPEFGPAILFWGYVLVVLGAGLVLARVPHSPLSARKWLLLALGLTQVPVQAALCIVAWFFALAYRARMPEQRRLVHNLVQLALAGMTLFAFASLYFAVQNGLVVRPDMQVMGAGSDDDSLRFYMDRVASSLPVPSVISVPLYVWELSMLAWSLWLAANLVRWLPWAFRCFAERGLWKKGTKKTTPIPPPPPSGPGSVPPSAPAAKPA